MTLTLSFCGALEVLDSVGGGNGGSNEITACDSDYQGYDTDGDGLSDDCEALTGTDINSTDTDGDGIQDAGDFPGDINNPEPTLEEAWWKAYANRILSDTSYSSVMTSSFLNNGAVPVGSKVTITEQRIYLIIDGEYGHSQGAEAYAFCKKGGGGTFQNRENFLYFFIKGNVQLCPSCQEKNDIMMLCGALSDSATLATFVEDQPYVENNFTWHIGKTLAGTFSPQVTTRRKNDPGVGTITITPKQKATNGSDITFNKVKIQFENSFKIDGQAKIDESSAGVEVKTPSYVSVYRNYVRLGSGTAEENPSVVGRYVNQASN
ncbi:MAG: hypothetical protein R3A45_09380 [Bdellovibrionota bacterium]